MFSFNWQQCRWLLAPEVHSSPPSTSPSSPPSSSPSSPPSSPPSLSLSSPPSLSLSSPPSSSSPLPASWSASSTPFSSPFSPPSLILTSFHVSFLDSFFVFFFVSFLVSYLTFLLASSFFFLAKPSPPSWPLTCTFYPPPHLLLLALPRILLRFSLSRVLFNPFLPFKTASRGPAQPSNHVTMKVIHPPQLS